MKFSYFLIITLYSFLSFGMSTSDVIVPNETVSMIMEFDQLSEEYAYRLISKITNQSMNSAFEVLKKVEGVSNPEDCPYFVSVSLPKRITSNPNNIEKRFEEEFFKIESLHCFSGARNKELASKYQSKAFQLESFDTLIHVFQNNSVTCHQTQVFGLGKSEYCYRQQQISDEKSLVLNSFLVSSDLTKDIPVYYRQIFDVFKEVNGMTVMYSVAFVRGVEMNSFFKSIAKGRIKDGQKKVMDNLGKEN